MPRINTRPEPIDVGDAVNVILTHSQSSPGMFHVTVELVTPAYLKRFGGEVTILCSCRGFQMHKDTDCWHVKYMKGEDEDE